MKKSWLIYLPNTVLGIGYTMFFSIVLLLLPIVKMAGQSVSGTIFNENKEPLSGVIISLTNLENEEIIGYNITNEKGNYQINNLKKGFYNITINALGYSKIENKIQLSGTIKNDFNLTPEKEQKIEEVIISSSKPIKIKSDTIELRAKAFLNGTEKNVEDLLKKLPGITVEENGKIKIGDQEVEKVMVENDDFFEKGYTLLTKNMSVRPIEKVQILQNYSNNKLLKGVENSNKVAINLTLSDEVKSEWFGNVTLSSSVFPESFYSEKINFSKFSKRAKYFLFGSTNTIGVDNIGDIAHLIEPSFLEEPGFINIRTQTNEFNANNSFTLPFGSDKAKFNNDKLASANAIFKINDKTKLKIVTLGNFEKFNFNKTSFTDFSFGDTQFSNVEDYNSQSKKEDSFNKVDLDFDISKKMTLKVSGNINYWQSNNMNNQNLNDINWIVDNNTNHLSTDNHLLFTNKINNKLVWLNGVRFINQNTEDFSFSNQFFFNKLFTNFGEIENFNQNSNSKLRFLGVVSQILYKTEKSNLWDLSIQNHLTSQGFANTISFEKNSVIQFLPEEYRNQFSNINNDLALILKFSTTFGKFKIDPKIEFHSVHNILENKTENPKKNDFFYIIPNLNISWAIHNKGKLNTSVFLSRNSTTMLEILPNYFSDSPRNLTRGLNNFEYFKNSGATISYSYGNWNDRLFINLFGSYNQYHNYLSDNYTINQSYTISNLLFLKNRTDQLYISEVSYYLKNIHSNFKFLYSFNRSKYEDQIENGNFRNVISNYNKIGFQLKSVWKKRVDYSLGSNFNFNKIKFNTQENKILSQVAIIELFYKLSQKTKINLKNSYYSFNGFFNKENSFNFFDLKINYDFNDDIAFSIIGNNLLNIKKYKETAISSISTYTTEYRLFPRYIMLEMSFGF